MTKDEFQRTVEALTRSTEVNLRKMPKWFEGTLDTLKALGEQKDGVHHPGHRGTAREQPLQQLLVHMLPKSMAVDKGFALNRLMTESKEQDLLIVDGSVTGSLLPQEHYFPIESCLASVQVKSTLTRTQIRDAIINCISIKRLSGGLEEEPEKKAKEYDKLCYAVFSYGSRSDLDKIADVLNEELDPVKRHLWPNMFYVLGQGLLIPGNDEGVPLDGIAMFREPRFRSVQKIGAEPALPRSEAYAFLWFLSNIIDHCMGQRRERTPPSCKDYWFSALALQTTVNEHIINEQTRNPEASETASM